MSAIQPHTPHTAMRKAQQNMLRTLVACGMMVLALTSMGQEWSRNSTAAWMVGLGSVRQLDTYLSPLEYKGIQLSTLRETQRMTHLADGRISFQSLLQGAFSIAENRPATANYWGGHLNYDAGWHYNWQPARGLRLMAGGMIGAEVGCLYNDRNGNNPVQARLNADLSASAAANYTFRLRHKMLSLRYQVNIPVAGCMFSPQYGQSYYEISLGNRDHNVVFTHPANAFSCWQLFTLDIPLQRYTLRSGYLCDIHQSHANHIKVHDYSHSFMIGLVRHFTLISPTPKK